MRDQIRCLVCGSSRYITFRNAGPYPNQRYQQPPNDSSRNSNKSQSKKKGAPYQTDYDLTQANEEFQKLLHEDEEPKADEKPSTSEAGTDHDGEEKSEVEMKQESEAEVKQEAGEKHDPTVEEIAKSLKKVRVKAPEEPAYDKSKSFFDGISCDTKEKAEEAFDQPQRQFERSRNEQTFGMNGGGYGRQYGAPRFYPRRNKWQDYSRNQQTFGGNGYGNYQFGVAPQFNSRQDFGRGQYGSPYYYGGAKKKPAVIWD